MQSLPKDESIVPAQQNDRPLRPLRACLFFPLDLLLGLIINLPCTLLVVCLRQAATATLVFPLVFVTMYTSVVSPRMAWDAKIVGFVFGPSALACLVLFMLCGSVVAALFTGFFGMIWHRATDKSGNCISGVKRCVGVCWDRETDCWDFLYYSCFGHLAE